MLTLLIIALGLIKSTNSHYIIRITAIQTSHQWSNSSSSI